MPLVRDPAIILQSFPFGETSKILRLATRGHGVLSAIARGALRPRSRFGGVLEPFSRGTATLYLKEGRELQTLSAFELHHTGQALGRDLLRFGGACLLAELVVRTRSEERDPALFHQLARALHRIETAPEPALHPTLLAETWSLTARLGFAPVLERCTACGRALEPHETAAFDPATGGTQCTECARHQPRARTLRPAARHTLRRLAHGRPTPVRNAPAHWRLLANFLAHHLADAGPIRSLAFLGETLARPR